MRMCVPACGKPFYWLLVARPPDVDNLAIEQSALSFDGGRSHQTGYGHQHLVADLYFFNNRMGLELGRYGS